jgi:hypothetical protein
MKKLFANIVKVDSNGIPYNIPNTQYKKWKINSLGFRGKERANQDYVFRIIRNPWGARN